eukprot:scaffold1459_cov260-Pinguiococcus_pyrenoidosus.AAC.15
MLYVRPDLKLANQHWSRSLWLAIWAHSSEGQLDLVLPSEVSRSTNPSLRAMTGKAQRNWPRVRACGAICAPPAFTMDFAPVKRDSPGSAHDDVAFVFIAMGPVAFGRVVDYAITSLRDVGGYRGRIFVLTDQERCFAHLHEDHARRGLQTTTIHAAAQADTLQDSIHNVALRRTRFRMLKTQILDYLPDDVQYAVFVDSDVMTTKEDCAEQFITQNTREEGGVYSNVAGLQCLALAGWCS